QRVIRQPYELLLVRSPPHVDAVSRRNASRALERFFKGSTLNLRRVGADRHRVQHRRMPNHDVLRSWTVRRSKMIWRHGITWQRGVPTLSRDSRDKARTFLGFRAARSA